ncbi:MAG: hypothetical protein M3444_13835, partial [Acidobacteriota bacterium]|nr:hypothetical protein [Acidobacteriota bacterium]
EEWGATLLALDSVDAGIGDLVLVVQEGWSASTAATGEQGAAIDSAIVGVVDHVDLLADEAKGAESGEKRIVGRESSKGSKPDREGERT